MADDGVEEIDITALAQQAKAAAESAKAAGNDPDAALYEGLLEKMMPKAEGDKYEYGAAYKGVGNTFFKNKQYEFALRTYTDCPGKLEKFGFDSDVDMLGDPEAATICCQCYSNAAQCALKLKNWKQTLELCDHAMEYFPKPVDKAKVLYRRGQAYIGLEELHKAIHAFEASMVEDPKPAIKKELVKAKAKLERDEKLAARRMFKGSKKKRDKLKEAFGYDDKSIIAAKAEEEGLSALELALSGEADDGKKALERFRTQIEELKEKQISDGTHSLIDESVLTLTFGAAFAAYVMQDYDIAALYFKDLLAKTRTKITTTAANAAANAQPVPGGMPRDSATTLGLSFDNPMGPHDAKGGEWVETEIWGEKLERAVKPLGRAVALNCAGYTFYKTGAEKEAVKHFKGYLQVAEAAGEQECIHNLPAGWQGRKITEKDRALSKWVYHVHTKAARFDVYCALGRISLDAAYHTHEEEQKAISDRGEDPDSVEDDGRTPLVITHADEATRVHELAMALVEKTGQRAQVYRALAASHHVAGRPDDAGKCKAEAEKFEAEAKKEEEADAAKHKANEEGKEFTGKEKDLTK